MRTRVALRATEQYRRSVELAASRSSREEDILLQVTEILGRVQMLATTQSSATATQQTRAHAKAEVDQIFRQVVDLANARFESGYLFGGADGDRQPYTIDETGPVLHFVSSNPTGQHTVEISEQRYMATNHNAPEIFESTGVLDAIRDLASGLQNDDPTGVGAALGKIEGAFSGVQALIGDIGARSNQLDLTRNSLNAVEVSMREYKAGLEEVNFEVAATELVNRQNALQAAMLATSRVMGLSLADYIR